jgi:hypothetical protein
MAEKQLEPTPVRKRAKRTPINGRNVLTVTNKDPDYEYRIVNDVGDRVQIFKQNDWELVAGSEVQVGDRRITAPSNTGSLAQASVDKQGTKAYVMRIRKDWYKEDQVAKMEALAEQEKAMKNTALSKGDYGEINLSR